MSFDEQLRCAFDALSDRLRAEIARELERFATDELPAAARVRPTEARASDLAASGRLVDAVRAIDRAGSLTEVLDIVVTRAGREAARVGILLVRGHQLRGWRFIGFDPALDAAEDVELAVHEGGIIAEALRAGTAASSDTAGRSVAPRFAGLPAGRQCFAVPIAMSGQPVAVLYADQGVRDRAEAELPTPWPDTLEVLARYAARSLEALTTLKTTRALTERPDGPASPAAEAAEAGRQHEEGESAHRYARLLVSEIKLYHEAAVAAGRRERDLGTRLAAEIERARALYEQRVPAQLRLNMDYFYAELVRTLADGDASLLGQPV